MTKTSRKNEPAGAEYSVPELAEKARGLFGTSPECVITALSLAGVEKSTLAHARGVVEKFMKQEVL